MVASWAFAAAANVVIGGLLFTIAVLLRRASPERAARGPLALYLALVGANYAIDASGRVYAAFTGGSSGAFNQASLYPAILDPVAFLLFALAVTDRRPGRLATAAIVVPGIALLALFALTPTTFMVSWRFKELYLLELGVYYVAGYALLADRYLRETSALRRDRLGILAVAFGVVILARLPLLFSDYGLANPARLARAPWRIWILFGALAFVTVTAFVVGAWRVLPANRAHARRSATALLALLGAVAATWTLATVPTIHDPAASLVYSVRWILFAAVLSIAVRRYDLLGLPQSAQARVRLAFTAALAVIALMEIAAILAPLPGSTTQITVLASAAVVGLCAIAYAALRRAIPDASPEAQWRRVDVYRAHLDLGAPAEELAEVRARLALSEADVRAAVMTAGRIALSTAPGPVLAEGSVFAGRYEVRQFLGAGNFGRAFLGWDASRGERVVLKELLAEWKGDPEAEAQFRHEATVALRIQHPNLVAFRALERAAQGHVLVLAHVEGESLRKRLARGPLPTAAVGRLARDLSDALAALHAAGIVHRDVKPDNVILRPDGAAVLLDFGSATHPGGTRPARDGHPGTPMYMAPEQAAGGDVGPQADVYALGVLLWEALTGAPPPLRAAPAGWDVVLARALEREPASRWRTTAELRAALPS